MKKITKKEQARVNRLISSAARRAGANREEISNIQKTIWELRSIISNDRDSGYIKAAMQISADIGPEYGIASINKLRDMGVIQDSDALGITKSIEKKYKTDSKKTTRIVNIFMQSSLVVTESGVGVLGPDFKNTRLTGKNRNQNPIIENLEDEEEVGKTVNRAIENLSRDYYRSIGLDNSVRDELLPITGYVVHKDQIKRKKHGVLSSGTGNAEDDAVFEVGDEDVSGDGLTAHGEIEIVLKPGVSNRSAYGLGNGIRDRKKPVRLNSTNKEDVSDALAVLEGANGKKDSMETMLHLLASSIDNDFSDVNSSFDEQGKMRPIGRIDSSRRQRKPLEAHVLGGFDINEIEQINYPFTKLNQLSIDENIEDVVNDKFITDILFSSQFNKEEVDYLKSTGFFSKLNTESMHMLRNYRLAMKLKNKYMDMGIEKFKIAHPNGVNIENPLSHSKGARPGQNVEEVLLIEIRNEVREMATKLIKDIRSKGRPSLMSRSGGKL